MIVTFKRTNLNDENIDKLVKLNFYLRKYKNEIKNKKNYAQEIIDFNKNFNALKRN